MRLARHGLGVTLYEGNRHPRFHIGESFLPRNLELIEELGLAEGLAALPQVAKYGASFGFAHSKGFSDYDFDDGLLDRSPRTFNIERAPFDKFLVDEARKAGVRVVEGVEVRKILRLEEQNVEVELRDRNGGTSTQRARWMVDASGHGTVVGRHLGTRTTLPDLKRIAYFGHFEGVERAEGIKGGYAIVLMCEEGWFWFIPIDERRTSIGLVMREADARKVNLPAKEMLAWGIERCPAARQRTRGATDPTINGVVADFSYSCRPFAGPGYFLVGDAATFIDPIFSTGVCMGMMTGAEAADAIHRVELGTSGARQAASRYMRFVEQSSSTFFRLVRLYYRHSFRELFVHGVGPLEIHRAVISLLCGHVFPRPPWSVRWRVRMFEILVRLNRRFGLVPRIDSYSLLDAAPVPSHEARDLKA